MLTGARFCTRSLSEPEFAAVAGKGAQPGEVLGPVESRQGFTEAAGAAVTIARRLPRIHAFVAQADQHRPERGYP